MSNLSDIKKAPLPEETVRSVSGIDALVFHIKINYQDYSEFYNNSLLMNVLSNDDNFELLSPSLGRYETFYNWYINIERKSEANEHINHQLKFCKITFKDLKTNDNRDSISIDMNTVALQTYTIKQIKSILTNMLNNLGLIPLDWQLNRVDLNTYVEGHNFEYLTYNLFSTRLRADERIYDYKEVSDRGVLETMYLGKRSSPLYFRIYNKLKELQKLDYQTHILKLDFITKKFIKKYHTIIDFEELWNVEFQIKREKLKYLNVYTLDDLETKVNSMHRYFSTNAIRLLEREKMKGEINTQRIANSFVWDHIINEYQYNDDDVVELDVNKLKVYQKDNTWLKNRINEYLEQPFNQDLKINSKLKEILLLLE